MLQPKFLKKQDSVLLVSPAGKVNKEDVNSAIEILNSWHLSVRIAPHTFASHYRFAGTIEERLSDLQIGLDSTDIKAIICTRGGYGSCQLLEQLKFDTFKKYPKWLVGFSDITTLHNYFNSTLKCESLHACMPINIGRDCNKTSIESLRKALWGEQLSYKTKPNTYNILGSASGEIVGGNLANICSLVGTSIGYNTKDKILFIEEIGEPVHNIDRMIKTLKFAGKLKNLKGLIVGSFSEIDTYPEFGKSIEQIIYDEVVDYKYPVVFNFPVGHVRENHAMYIGRVADLKISEHGSFFTFR